MKRSVNKQELKCRIKQGDEVIGNRIKVKVVKNKIAPPFRTAEFDLIYNEGISTEGEMLALGEKYKFIRKSGSSYTYLPPGGDESTEVKLGRGYDASRQFLRSEKKLSAEIMKHIRKALKEEGSVGSSPKITKKTNTEENESASEGE